MKYQNKDGISLNYTGDDIHTRLVKEVILEAIDKLNKDRRNPELAIHNCKGFLTENFDIVEVENL